MILSDEHLWPRSTLPPGGSPTGDRAYLVWRDAFVAEANARYLDRMARPGRDLPAAELIEPWRLDEWLFLRTGGTRMFEPPTYLHRLRHVAIHLEQYPRAMKRLAHTYAACRAAEREDR